MSGLIQNIDVTARLVANKDRLSEVEGEISVIDFEVERVFGGGGSTAKVTTVFPDNVHDEQFLNTLATATKNPYSDPSEGGPGGYREDIEIDTSPIVDHSEHPLDIEIDITIESPVHGAKLTKRLFTGHVIKITESSKGTITFEAMDARYYFNKNMVSLNTGQHGEGATVILAQIMMGGMIGPGADEHGDGLGFEPGKDYRVILDDSPTVTDNYGVKAPISAYEVVQDLAERSDAIFHIDNYNRVHFVDLGASQIRNGNVDGGIRYWGTSSDATNTLPPIVEWNSGDENADEHVVASSPYDETGLGIMMPETIDKEDESDGVITGREIDDKNIISRKTLEKQRDNTLIQNAMTTDSGTMRVIGWPNIQPNDQVRISGSDVGKFTPISYGNYTVKTARHILDPNEGYVTEIELGKGLEELYEEFADISENARKTSEGISKQKEKKTKTGGFPWAPLPGEFNTVGIY